MGSSDSADVLASPAMLWERGFGVSELPYRARAGGTRGVRVCLKVHRHRSQRPPLARSGAVSFSQAHPTYSWGAHLASTQLSGHMAAHPMPRLSQSTVI